ncbi:MAG: radical SAM protein [Candidatus Hermodarchaeota archaeon]
MSLIGSQEIYDLDPKMDLLKALTQSRVSRRILRSLVKKCQSCGNTRLNVGLELIARIRQHGCRSCRLAASIIRRVILGGSSAFGADPEFVIKSLSDSIFRRSLSSVISGLARFGARTPFVPGAPFQVVWNVTRACNLKCKHCYEIAGTRNYDEMSTQDALSCIERLSDAGIVFLAFSGGEPSLRPDILTLIRQAAEKGIYVAMATNGTTLSRAGTIKKFKEAGLKFVQISLDGASEATHDDFRGVAGAFRKTVQAIKNCVAEGVFVEVAMTVTRHNLAELFDTVQLCRSLGVRWFMVYNFVPVGRGTAILESDLTPNEREKMLHDILDMIRAKSSSEDMDILTTAPQLGRVARMASGEMCESSCQSSVDLYPTHFFNARLPVQMRELSKFIGGCGAGRFYLTVEPNGDIYPCVFFPHIPKVRVGNILRDDFQKLWNENRVLNDLRNKDLLKGACSTCESRFVCGGCRARAIQYFDDYHAPDPGCIKNVTFWKALKAQEKVHERFRAAIQKATPKVSQRG